MRLPRLASLATLALSIAAAAAAPATPAATRAMQAAEVMESIQAHFWLERDNLYARDVRNREPDFMWGNGVMFSALAAAARHDPPIWLPVMRKFFRALDRYWDDKAKVPGYEPAPTAGNGHDKYYDDNAWMVLTFLEAYEMTRDTAYLRRARQTLEFVWSGWDDQAGGGIWWHEQHKDGSKNTCSNAPAAAGCFALAKFLRGDDARLWVERGGRIADWTVAKLQNPDGLYADNLKVADGRVNRGTLTYNTGLMIRALLGRHAHTGNEADLREAIRIGKAAAGLLDRRGTAYRDPPKWAHLMVEADLALFRKTGDQTFMQRANNNGDVHFERWQTHPPSDLLDNASIARELWLLAEAGTAKGQAFWKEADRDR